MLCALDGLSPLLALDGLCPLCVLVGTFPLFALDELGLCHLEWTAVHFDWVQARPVYRY